MTSSVTSIPGAVPERLVTTSKTVHLILVETDGRETSSPTRTIDSVVSSGIIGSCCAGALEGAVASTVGLDDDAIRKASQWIHHHQLDSFELVIAATFLNDNNRAVTSKQGFHRGEPVLLVADDDQRRCRRRRSRHLHVGSSTSRQRSTRACVARWRGHKEQSFCRPPPTSTYDIARAHRQCVDEAESGVDLDLGCLTHASRGYYRSFGRKRCTSPPGALLTLMALMAATRCTGPGRLRRRASGDGA